MDSGNSRILIILVVSLMITSFLISFFVMAVYGYSIKGINTLDTGLSAYSSNTNLVSNCSISDYELSGSWSCNFEGLSLIGGGSLRKNISSEERSNGIYKTTYHLYPKGGNYYVLIYEKFNGVNSILEVKDDGLHIPYAFLSPIFGDAVFIPYSGASSISDVRIEIIYDTLSPSLNIKFNDNSYNIDVDKLAMIHYDEIKYVTGIGADNSITLNTLSIDFTEKSSGGLDFIQTVIAFFGNVLTLLVWNIDPMILPWEINFLLIKTQEIGIFISALVAARG